MKTMLNGVKPLISVSLILLYEKHREVQGDNQRTLKIQDSYHDKRLRKISLKFRSSFTQDKIALKPLPSL